MGLFWRFCSKLGKYEFPRKKSCQFLNIQIIYDCAKKQKQTNMPFQRTMLN